MNLKCKCDCKQISQLIGKYFEDAKLYTIYANTLDETLESKIIVKP